MYIIGGSANTLSYKKIFFLVFSVVVTLNIYSLDFNESGYGSISDYLTDAFGIDRNAGLTAFPVLNVPMGGRSEGMATAFVSVVDDISFIESNPAGSSMLEKSELAFFHNNWIADTKLEGLAYTRRIKDLGLDLPPGCNRCQLQVIHLKKPHE